ncbi:hypothetical protein VTI74DRAFT_2969 [Chaetomium olivicolor]
MTDSAATPFSGFQLHIPPDSADDNSQATQFAQTLSEDVYSEGLKHFGERHFVFPADKAIVWVKFGGSERQAEGEMQKLAWHWARRERLAGRNETTFIVMQLLQAVRLSECVQYPASECHDLIAEGIQLLRRMPVPDDATPGPYTRDRRLRLILHPALKDYSATVVYKDIDELQAHITRVLDIACPKAPLPHPAVNLERQLVFCYCDFNDENFMFSLDASGRLRLYIIDFEWASFLPVSFLSFALFCEAADSWQWITAEPLIQRISHTLPKDNLEVMGHADDIFWASAHLVGFSESQCYELQHPRT